MLCALKHYSHLTQDVVNTQAWMTGACHQENTQLDSQSGPWVGPASPISTSLSSHGFCPLPFWGILS